MAVASPDSDEARMLASMMEWYRAAQDDKRREASLRRKLRRWDLRLRRFRSGYAVVDRVAGSADVFGATLAQVEAWVAARRAQP